MREEDRALRVEPDDDREGGKEGREEHQAEGGPHDVHPALHQELLGLEGLPHQLDERLTALPHDDDAHAGHLEDGRHGEHVAAGSDGVVHHLVERRAVYGGAEQDGFDSELIDDAGEQGDVPQGLGMRRRNHVHETQDGVLRAVSERPVAADAAAGGGGPDQDCSRGRGLASNDVGVHRVECQAEDRDDGPEHDGRDGVLRGDEGEAAVPEGHPQREGCGQGGVSYYIERAGGFSRRTVRSRTCIVRPNGSVDAYSDRLQPGAQIVVPEATVGEEKTNWGQILSSVPRPSSRAL